ncbi:MAG TPA: cyclic nucleotide-binding domain-containing protein [Candidatus Acidoferrum sp.]|nr:cyclic nucleotide-binding domain-containing protein [Candidatus Acidoferrum sp.]
MSRPGAICLEDITCGDCALGRASGADRGQFCPFIIRRYGRGDLLCLAGDPVDYVWFIKEGVVGLSRSRELDQLDEVEGLCLAGSFVGLECLVGDRYLRTARALSNASLCGATREGFLRWMRVNDERVATIMRAALEDPILVGHADHLASRLPGPEGGGPAA